MIRDLLRRVRDRFKKREDRPTRSHKRTVFDLWDRPPLGHLKKNFEPVSPEEDKLISIGQREVKFSVILEFYDRWFRWHPLADDEDIDFFGPQEQAEAFWKAIHDRKAVEYYGKSMLAAEECDFNPLLLYPGQTYTLPCRTCGIMLCSNMPEHFGFTPEEFVAKLRQPTKSASV